MFPSRGWPEIEEQRDFASDESETGMTSARSNVLSASGCPYVVFPRGWRGTVLPRSPSAGGRAMTTSIQSDAESTVLVVDDDPDVRSGLKLLLESVGLTCVAFSSVRDFLQNQPSVASNCLILDVRMPGMGGLDFQKELAKARNKVPIIFITGHGDIPMSVDAMKAGAVDFLTKPLREQAVLDAVRTALDRGRADRMRDVEISELQMHYRTLSEREREIMPYVVAGLMNKQTADKVGLTEGTVKTHRHNLMKKMRAESLAELVQIAAALGLTRVK
jgi:FixJ family two-component response regulator